MSLLNRFERTAVVLALVLGLSGCGGGGGGGDAAPVTEAPPATAAALQGSGSEAGAAAVATVASAERLVQLSASLDSGLVPVGGSAASPLSWSRVALSATRARALATETIPCANFFGTTACSGSVTVDTNASGSSSVVPAGTYVSMTFNALQGSMAGVPMQLSGTLRVEFLTAFDLNATSYAGLRFQLSLTNFSGVVDGVSFGPETEVALFEFDAQGVEYLTIDGLRISGLDSLVLTDAANYSLNGIVLRRAHWTTPTGYIDLRFTGWTVSNGRPLVNSLAAIEVPNSRISLVVRSSSTGSVVYEVTALINGVVTIYQVTATYPAGGGAPTYTVVPG